uniref:Tyrosine specific protein phosphatases domain-containing protein n=1 Tax=Pyrodinium bahamense TaxID=73915 RepID=A0A7S0FXE8_9DINO|mmetsp:Transcript_53472/g.148187  ORF Transcript_53472/g.148187 Transcript_53472/m.148187 type:complete len:319 (+) Transcript_53472:77-1033(+)|eukprot:CAMPEP_0179045400 /NCGR_PEP_ID=MMETSP0796-20121207/18157_1 /TAXON_ID=73915 /ORGANISM="Pyrodinium bahamense, Strain pbaha01" /LENGTH=318 /DNA_ID=CAMNT_0020741803 /DNA_START=77 /DNA_END=1033 /DNA_ORIENTATION=+
MSSREEGKSALSDEYSETMKAKMGSTLVYKHEDGMNYARASPRLFVGSCLQSSGDVEKLHGDKVGVIFCLQEDKDMAHFSLDIAPIQKRAAELGIKHVREPITDFDPFSLRRRLPSAVRRLAQELLSRPEDESAYIHCTAGLGRAPGVALAYMFWVDARCLDEAYASLFEVRRCHPQLGMIRAATCDMLAGEEGGLQSARIAIAREGASTVQIAGLDVGWGNRLPLEKDAVTGQFVLTRGLPAGTYQYKFIVDGEWLACPELPTVDDNGNLNNVLEVAPGPGSPDAERRSRIMASGGRPTEEEQASLQAQLRGPAPSA